MADHSFRVALFALVASSSQQPSSSSPAPTSSSAPFDASRAVKIALVHDLAEAIVGDIAPGDNVPKDEKARREAEAMAEMRRMLEGCSGGNSESKNSEVTVGAEVEALFEEYERGETPEAQLVKDCDKLEMLLQAVEYEREGKEGNPGPLDLSEFFESVRGRLKTEVGRRWGLEIEGRRPKRG